ncbi:hypothetical protein [Micromonospora sp. NPDC047740]|uniref:hypothetical protein n=1 Tax=Micromonospora sp. NPDC047740 TaxID=3364254 RepID=UPI003714AD7A
MFEAYRASDETVAAWRVLAQRVREALDLAGIPNHSAGDSPRPAGAEIEIDHGNDEMGGVFVDWRPADALTGAVAESTMEGRPDAPAIQLFMAIATSMRDAMIGILHASGFNVVPVDDYAMRPPAIHVLR